MSLILCCNISQVLVMVTVFLSSFLEKAMQTMTRAVTMVAVTVTVCVLPLSLFFEGGVPVTQ